MKRGLLFLLLLLNLELLWAYSPADSARFKAFIRYAEQNKLAALAPGERVGRIAQYFIGTPYEAGTLEAPGSECLQINLRAFDCNTFVENVVVLSVLFEQQEVTFDMFRRILETIRYRDGFNAGYASRLHYASDWLYDNESKHFFEWVQPGSIGKPFVPNVNYMSTHSQSYPALKDQPLLLPYIADREKVINTRMFTYVPKAKVTSKATWIKTGDVVVITTNTAGLDFSHMGIAIRRNGLIYLLHASSTSKKVQISNVSLRKYLADVKKHTGIVVVRPI